MTEERTKKWQCEKDSACRCFPDGRMGPQKQENVATHFPLLLPDRKAALPKPGSRPAETVSSLTAGTSP